MSIINTRIQLKYDTLANWEASTFTLKKGEVAIATLGEVKDGSLPGDVNQHPVLFKVGDGEHTFAKLPFASALAADVYAWAKKDRIEITKNGDGNVVASISWDSVNNKIVYETASVATAEGMKELSDALGELTEKVNAMYTNTQIDEAIAGAKKEVADDLAEYIKTNDEALAGVKGTAEAAEKKADADLVRGRVKDLEDHKDDYKAYADTAEADAISAAASDAASKYATIGAVEAAQADATAAKNAIDAFLDENAVSDDVVNTLKEIQAELDKGEGSAASLLAEIDKIKDGTTTTKANSLDDTAVEQVKGIKVTNAEDADKLGGQLPEYYATKASVTAITETDGIIDTKVKALADGQVKTNTEAIAAINDEENGILKQAQDYADGLAGNYDAAGSAAGAESAAKEYADGLNTAMDARVAALEDGTSIYDVDEVETGANNVKYLTFYCGTASDLID